MTNKTRQELNLDYWGRVVPMCKGTALEGCEWECVKRGSDPILCHPSFITQDWDLAVAILEDSPIFVGDFIYDKHGSRYEVLPIDHSLLKGCVRISYESSERIDELVVPFNLFSEEYTHDSHDQTYAFRVLVNGTYFYFRSREEAFSVASIILSCHK